MKSLIPCSKPERFTFEIYLTEKCSYDCEYCTIHTPKIKFNKIDFGLMMSRDIDPSADVYIYGGEPLIHPELSRVIEVLEARGHNNIVIQSNLSSSVSRITKFFKYESVSFQPSFHYEWCEFKEFNKKVELIDSYGKLGHMNVMWIMRLDRLIYMIYRVFNSKYENVHLEPTLPWSQDYDSWSKKDELIAFDSKYDAKITKDYNERIIVDGVEKTVLQSYIDNDDLDVRGIKCGVVKQRINYDAHLNVWRTCSSDLFMKVDNPAVDEFHKVCVNDFCMLDLFYEKQR